MREEARATYISVVRALAEHSSLLDQPDGAVRYLLRLLEGDRYDEDAHLRLVAALVRGGRYGEAQRHYLVYRRAMEELGVEPVAFPGGSRSASRRD